MNVSAPALHVDPVAGRRVPIPFRRLVRTEWSKATDTRAARWLLGLVVLTTAATMVVPVVSPSSFDPSHASYLRVAAIALTIPLPVVAILMVTSDWSRRSVLTTFTHEPRRVRVLGAQLVVSLMLSVGGAAVGGLVTAAAVGVATASGRTLDADLSAGHIGGFVVFVALNVLAGVALGMLLHSSAAAIATSFALPATFAVVGTASSLVSEWIDMSTTWDAVLADDWTGRLPQTACSVAFWVVVPLTAGVLRTTRRDIT